MFKFLVKEGLVTVNIARLMRTPKAPRKLPEVMSADQANTIVDGVSDNELDRPYPVRDRAILELL